MLLPFLPRGHSTHDKLEYFFVLNVAGLSFLTFSGRGQTAVGAPGPGGVPRPVSLQLRVRISKRIVKLQKN